MLGLICHRAGTRVTTKGGKGGLAGDLELVETFAPFLYRSEAKAAGG